MSGTRRSAATLALALLVAVAALGAVERLTAERREAARAARLAEALAAALPGASFGADPAPAPAAAAAAPGAGAPRALWRGRRDGRVVGAVLDVIAPDGYGGPIELLVGVGTDGRIGAVRVVAHRETPGLGDRIERARSDWIARFDGRSLDADAPRAWRVVRAGARAVAADTSGTAEFDALSGATVTSRAVVDAVHGALRWVAAHRDEAFGP